jgi:uncharacterized protein YndB with AHSA1/START domain
VSDVQITVDLPYPAEVVWRALTERRLMSEWFLPTDLAPVAGGIYRVFPPPGLAGFGAPFDVDVLEVVVPQRLLQRWRGEQLHTEMLWEITPAGTGSHLRVVQSGFLGLQGDRRRSELLEAHGTLFQERLPALLARLALDDVLPPPPVRVPLKMPAPAPDLVPARRPFWHVPVRQRLRLLSIAGAIVLTVLIATALATLVVIRPPSAPADALIPPYVPGLDQQAGPSASAQPVSPTPSASSTPIPVRPSPSVPSAQPVPSALTAGYRTAESYSLSYIGSISIKAGETAVDGWTAIIEVPQGVQVTSAWDQVEHHQTGRTVTFSSEAHRRIEPGITFTLSFQAGGADGGQPLSCTVNGVRCSGF